MAQIQTTSKKTNADWTVDVTVSEGASSTQHTVTVPEVDFEKLTSNQVSVDDLVTASFRFLLKHEPKEAILSDFNIMTIAQYFPQFPQSIRKELKIA